MSDKLSDRLAVAAGWTHIDNFGAKFWHRGQCRITHDHPFPPGRIDPILDLMRERLPEWFVWMLEEDGLGNASATLCLRGRLAFGQDGPTQYSVAGEGPDLWTALASAVLAALEKKA